MISCGCYELFYSGLSSSDIMSLPTSASDPRAQSLLTISLSSIRRWKHDYEDADIGPKHKTGKKSDPGSHADGGRHDLQPPSKVQTCE